MAVEMVCQNQDLKEQNCYISVIIGDDDACTESALRRDSVHDIEKWSDMNHSKKAFTSHLYLKNVPVNLHEYFKSMMGTAIKSNKGNPEAVRKALKSIPKHAWGDHSECGSWCDKENHIYKHLPGGKALTDKNLQEKLTENFDRLARNAKKLAPCGSTQANESFNNEVTRKHPKMNYYGDSESFNYRVAAAVCQHNEGTSYITEVKKKLGLSPGKETEKFREKKDMKRQYVAEKNRTIEKKRRRILLKKMSKTGATSAERKEGVTYSSECGLDGIGLLTDVALGKDTGSVPVNDGGYSVVVFDLETSGLHNTADILQIAAVDVNTNEKFSVYIHPSRPLPWKITDITGLSVSDGKLYLKGERVVTSPPRIALFNFISFLKRQSKNVILIAHNGLTFDAKHLCRALKNFNLLDTFKEVVTGFCDSLPLFHRKLPDRKEQKITFRLTALAVDILGIPDDGAHNAIWDVTTLNDLLSALSCSNEDVRSSSVTVDYILNTQARKDKVDLCKKSLAPLTNFIKPGMMKKFSDAYISLDILKESARCGERNLYNTCAEDVNGKPRVTKSKKIIAKLYEGLRGLL